MRLIKRYKNRRLYDTQDKRMITIENLSTMVKEGEEFTVVDNVTKKDITGEILTTILKLEAKSWKDFKEMGNLIRTLIARKSKGATDVIRNTALASLGAVSLDRKRAEEIISELIQKGKVEKQKKGEEINKLLSSADKQSKILIGQSKKLLAKAEGQIKSTLENLSGENRREIEEIKNRMRHLEETLRKIESKL
ncbi:MAG: hypothetical protein CO189_11705 [candidate division Zixibacteria bacterium CG_4_9_14_3_um_filter_46_8]|nr:MAG: hypothetical protein CO189_11705 [candidate division Zixibacteria bacterium CG_4_9_14_3_um_filter_46_8]